jgi:hypothetical protein
MNSLNKMGYSGYTPNAWNITFSGTKKSKLTHLQEDLFKKQSTLPADSPEKIKIKKKLDWIAKRKEVIEDKMDTALFRLVTGAMLIPGIFLAVVVSPGLFLLGVITSQLTSMITASKSIQDRLTARVEDYLPKKNSAITTNAIIKAFFKATRNKRPY